MKAKTLEQIGLKWGLIVFVILSVYFFTLKLLGFQHIIEFRLFNGVIMYFGIYMAIREFKKSDNEFNYFKGLGTGIITASVATSIFALFGFIYLFFINPSFLESIRQNEMFGIYMTRWGAPIQIFIEGMTTGCIMSYANMQLLKKPHLSKTDQEMPKFNALPKK
jgi:hypothetical protein